MTNLKWSRSMNTTAMARGTALANTPPGLQAVVQQVAVGQAGERVVVGLVLELHLVALALDRVLHRAQQQLAVEAALDEVVLRPALHRGERERLVVVAGEHDDRHRGRVRVDLGEGLQAMAVGQRQVEQHQRGVVRRELLQAVRQAVGAMQRGTAPRAPPRASRGSAARRPGCPRSGGRCAHAAHSYARGAA